MNIRKLKSITLFYWLDVIYKFIKSIYNQYFLVKNKSKYAYFDDTAEVRVPCSFNPLLVELYQQTRIASGFRLISEDGKFIMKKYSAMASDCTAIPANHISTVTVPHAWLGINHINDSVADIVVEEDCWIGYRNTLLKGAHLGRGCICAACSLINREIPPYAVVAGSPAKIVAVKFSKEQILEHEKKLYKPEERFSEQYIDELFDKFYKDKKIFGTSELSEKDIAKLDKFKEKRGFDYIS